MMPRLLLAPPALSTLQTLAVGSLLSEELRSNLRTALNEPVSEGTPSANKDSPPGPKAAELPAIPPPRPSALHHSLLVQVVTAVRESGEHLPEVSLASLVQNASVYIPTREPYKRPPELDALLAKIKSAHDKLAYDNMLPTTPATPKWASAWAGSGGTKHRAGFVPAVPSEPTLLNPADTEQDDKEAWQQIRTGMSAIASVLLSMAGVVTGVWQAGGTASVIWKTLVALFLALVVASAETFLYMRAFGFFRTSSEESKSSSRSGASRPTHSLPAAAIPDESTLARLRAEQEKVVVEHLKQQGPALESQGSSPGQAARDKDQAQASSIASRPGPRKRKGKQR